MADHDIDVRLDETVQAYEPGPAGQGDDRPSAEQEEFATHLDVPLDEDEPATSRQPVYVDVVARDDTRLPIIPSSLRGWENLQATTRYHVGRTAHRVAYHAVRAIPLYLPLAVFWSVIGVFRVVGRQLRWWWHPEMSGLLQQAASDGDTARGPSIHSQLGQARKARGLFVLAELAALAIAVPVLIYAAPAWAAWMVVVVAVPVLAHFGRPKTVPIVHAAVVAPRFRRINPDVVLRAYYAAKLGREDKADEQITFGGRMTRDAKETGSMVLVNLPYGGTFESVMKAKDKIASGLDVSAQQVFLTKDLKSERTHELFVADRDPLAIPVGRTDMLNGKARDIWKPIRLGRDERDRLVTLPLMWISILIGAQPRKGKTFFVRLILLYAALDPWVKILLADGKKSPDYDKFSLVAHRMVIGDAPNPRDNDPIEHLIDMLDEVLDHIAEVNDILSTLPVELCPEGKLTRELARDPRYPALRVWILALEEFQVYFETEDQDTNKLIASKLQRIMAQGPSAGVILLSSSQKPSGIGAGQEMGRLFNRFRDNHQVRFALRCGNMDVSKAVLGGDSYAEGHDASSLPIGDGTNGTLDYRGVGILYGASDVVPTVRTFLADHQDAERILIAARKLREAEGTLSGAAAGERLARQRRDVLADVRSVFYAGEAWISWPQIAQRLADELPEHYADVAPDAISAQVRALKVPSIDGRDKSQGNKVVKGTKVAAVDAAIERRKLEMAS